MGAATTRWDDPAGPGALVLVWGLGCGAAASLDAGPATTTGTSAEISTGASTGTSIAADTTTGTTGTDAPPDVADPTDLPPEACPAGCEVELPLAWSFEDEPLEDRELLAMVRTADGSLVVAERHGAAPWLTRVSRDGELVWSTGIALACACQIVDLAMTATDQLLVLGEGMSNEGYPVFVLSSHTLLADDVSLSWRSQGIVYGSPDRPGRVGSVTSLEDGSIATLVVESGLDADTLAKDWFEVRYFSAGGDQQLSWMIDTQVASGPPRRPRAAALPRGELATTLVGSATLGDYVVWAPVWFSYATAVEPASGPADAMAAGRDAAVVVAGIDRSDAAQPVLRIASLPRTEPPAWGHTVDVPEPGAGGPTMVVDADGRITVAQRTAPAGEAAVMLVQLAPDGSPLWATTLPIAAADAAVPVVLSLADDDQDLVLAALVDGHLHLERREQGCRCD